MDSQMYLTASEGTEKKFPDGETINKVNHVCLLVAMEQAIQAAARVDKLKKALIYGKQYEFSDLSMGLGIDYATVHHATELPLSQTQMELLHAGMGKVTEAGEALEIIREYVLGGNLDSVHLCEEVGDGFWYDAIIARITGRPFDAMTTANIVKLAARYPNGFDEIDAEVRNLMVEQGLLEKHLDK